MRSSHASLFPSRTAPGHGFPVWVGASLVDARAIGGQAAGVGKRRPYETDKSENRTAPGAHLLIVGETVGGALRPDS